MLTWSPGSITILSFQTRNLLFLSTGQYNSHSAWSDVLILSVCRYEDSNGNHAVFLSAGKKPDDCKMVAKALFSFQVGRREEEG